MNFRRSDDRPSAITGPSRGRVPSAVAAIAALLLAPWPLARAAAELPDPTRPPVTQQRAANTPSPVTPSVPPPLLQSVLIGEGRKPSAIIDGRLVNLGDLLDNMRLTRLTANAAVLTGPRGETSLALTPGADKRPSALAPLPPARPARALALQPGPTTLSLQVAEQK